MFETFEHTADVGLRIRAESFAALLVDAARGLFSLMVEDLASVRPLESSTIAIAGSERDLLLFDWLSELLYLFESRRLICCDFQVQCAASGIQATATGEVLDRARHRIANEVKAITYHGLFVEQTAAGWQAEVILDI